jgi:hypothetical protein
MEVFFPGRTEDYGPRPELPLINPSRAMGRHEGRDARMTETGDALRVTSDALMRDLEVLSTLEEEKRSISPGDPRLIDLAERIESIASRILGQSVRQRELTERIDAMTDAGAAGAPDVAIEDTPRTIAVILAEWRDAERRLAAAVADSAEAKEARILVDSLRTEDGGAHEAARRHNG